MIRFIFGVRAGSKRCLVYTMMQMVLGIIRAFRHAIAVQLSSELKRQGVLDSTSALFNPIIAKAHCCHRHSNDRIEHIMIHALRFIVDNEDRVIMIYLRLTIVLKHPNGVSPIRSQFSEAGPGNLWHHLQIHLQQACHPVSVSHHS